MAILRNLELGTRGLRGRLCRIGFRAILLAGAILGGAWPELADAHQISAVGSKASFNRDGTFVFNLSLDVTGSADPKLDQTISPEQAALTYLREALEFRFDDSVFHPSFGPLQVVERQDPFQKGDDLIQLQTEAKGRIPPGAKSFQVRLSSETDVALVMVVSKDGITQRRAQTLFAGEVSRPVDLGFVGEPVAKGDPFEAEKASDKLPTTWWDGVRAGAAQMLAPGGKRVLVVVTLLVLAMGFWATGAQLLSFAAGSLAGHFLLRTLGWSFSDVMEDRLLALALFGVAFDNVSRFKIAWSRFCVALLAGGLVGLASRNPEFEQSAVELLSYQAGVLLVSAVFAVVMWIILGPFRSQTWYRERLIWPLSFGVIGVGIFWIGAVFLGNK